jgi:hypothetical protein
MFISFLTRSCGSDAQGDSREKISGQELYSVFSIDVGQLDLAGYGSRG